VTNAELLFEAAATAVDLGWALLAWVAVLAALGTAILLGTLAALWWVCRTAVRRIRPAGRAGARSDYQAAA